MLQHSLETDGGGGNRVSEDQIKNYLRNTLGEEAPQPEWGLPDGWGAFMSGAPCVGVRRRVIEDL